MSLLKRLDAVRIRCDFRNRASAGLVLLAALACFVLAFGASPAHAQGQGKPGALPQFLIVDYHPVSKTLVAGTSGKDALYDYAYRVDVRNSGAAVADVSAGVASTKKHFVIVQPDVRFGPVPARATAASQGSFVVRASCHFDHRLDPWRIGGAGCEGKPGKDDFDLGDLPPTAQALVNKAYSFFLGKLFVWQIQVRAGSAPKVSAARPTGLVNNVRPQLGASFEDTGGGVAPGSLVLLVDGVDVSGQASVTAAGFSLVPATPLKDGAHQVALSIADLAGHATQLDWSFVTDSIAPVITGAAPRDITTANGLAPIGAQYSDAGSGINLAAVVLEVDGVDVSAQAEAGASGISYKPTVKLANGPHAAVLTVADAAGNSTRLAWTFTIDQSGPAVSGLQPANNAVLAADAVPVIGAAIGNGMAALDAAATVLEVDGVNVNAQAVLSATGVRYTPPAALAEGNHVARLSLKDQYGNLSVTTWDFVTRTAPEIVQVAPKDVTLNAKAAQTISAQYRDVGAGIDAGKVSLLIDGVDVSAQAQRGAGSLSYTPGTPLPQGVHIVTLTVTDKAGNSASSTWRFIVYTGMPAITEMSPQDALLASGTPRISAAYQDAGDPAIAPGIDTASVRLTVDQVDVSAKAQVSATGVSWQPLTPLADGLHTVSLTIADKAANEVNAVWSFLTDTGTPQIAATVAPADGTTLAADALPAISATFEGTASGIDVARVRLEIDNVDVTARATVTAAGIAYVPGAPLQEGSHVVKLTVPNKVGTAAVRSWTFKTATAPSIGALSPWNVFLPGGAMPAVSAGYSDIGAGVDPAKVVLQIDGVDVSARASIGADAVSYQVAAPLADGIHQVYLSIADRAGNTAESAWSFATVTPPQIGAITPNDAVFPANARPVIAAQFPDAGGIDPASVHLLLNGEDVTASALVSGAGISYTPPAGLPAGNYSVYLSLANAAGTGASAVASFRVEAPRSYAVTIHEPAGAQTVVVPNVEVFASAQSNQTFPVKLTLNGLPMTMSGTAVDGIARYRAPLTLIDGLNTLVVQATFADGETRSTSTELVYDAPPAVTITSPADKAMLGRASATSAGNLTGNVERPVTITGRVSKPVASVRINQQAATLAENGMEYRFENFFLHEGSNLLTVVATDARGRIGMAAILVSVDQTAPILTVEAPIAGSVTSSATVDLRGMVNDAVEAFAGSPEPRVTVSANGVTKTALVADRYYLVQGIPLQIGENTLAVTATDQFGNVRSQDVQVSRIAVATNRLTVLSGNNQSARSGAELAQPLVVMALGASGEPLADTVVAFDVMRGTGSISPVQGQAAKPNGLTAARNVKVTTDSSGRARVWLRAGKQSGAGANVVRASNPAMAEEAIFTASTERGAVSKVNADLGTNQFAETGGQPLELMSVVVRDGDDNPLPNVPVVYTVEQGDAYFSDSLGGVAQDGGKRMVLNTDKNGITALRPSMGIVAGLVRISARALRESSGDAGNPADLTGNATFLVQVKKAQNGPAAFNGFVYTDKGQPLAGVRVSIGRTALASTTDALGQFAFDAVPPGRIDLFVDGRTVNPANDPSQKQWPSLHFESYAVRGQSNELPHPIYLPPLLVSEARTVGGAEDVVLTMPGLQGFQMKVKANSVTFPDGSHVGTLVVSPVTADRLPMAPPAGGAQFGVPAWTVQPAGTRFDPPVQVTLPNAAGNLPGDNLPIVQWDHDLGQFVPMGRATVSEDGAFLITDAGSGITKAGWGGLCRYDPDKCAKQAPPKCNQCEELSTGADCPTCRPKEPCKPDPNTQSFTVEFPKKVEIMARAQSLIRRVPFISTLNIEMSASGKQETGKQCCSNTSVFEKCLGPYPFSETSGQGELKVSAGVGPAILNWSPLKTEAYWGRDRWTFELGTEVSLAKVTFSATADAKIKTTTCPGEDCTTYALTGAGSLNIGDVKLKGSAVLEEPDGRPSWNRWTVLVGAGVEGSAAFKAGGISASASYSNGANCSSSGDTSKIEWDEVAAEIKAGVTVKIPGIVWPVGGYQFSWKYVIVEKGSF